LIYWIRCLKADKAGTPEFAELKRRLGWEFMDEPSMNIILKNLGGESRRLTKNGKLAKKMEADFGSGETWEKDFKATGAMRGIGVVVLYQDMQSGKLINFWIMNMMYPIPRDATRF